MWTVHQPPPGPWGPGGPLGLWVMSFWAWMLSRANLSRLTFSRHTSIVTRSLCWRRAAVRFHQEGVPQRLPRPAGTPRAMSSSRSIHRLKARSTPAASAWRSRKTARWMPSSQEESARRPKEEQRPTRTRQPMSAHPVSMAPGRAMSQLVPLVPREEKASRARLVH